MEVILLEWVAICRLLPVDHRMIKLLLRLLLCLIRRPMIDDPCVVQGVFVAIVVLEHLYFINVFFADK